MINPNQINYSWVIARKTDRFRECFAKVAFIQAITFELKTQCQKIKKYIYRCFDCNCDPYF